MKKILFTLFFGLSCLVNADPRDGGDPAEPVITIIEQEDKKLYEYRVNGEIVEIKVVPKVGPVYYLVPADGGFIRADESQLLVPSWKLFTW